MSINKAILVGNVGADPKVSVTASGQQVATISVATNARWVDKAGQKQEATEWHRVVVWGRLAAIVEQFVKKGRQVYIEGRIQTRQWQEKDGQKRFSTEIVAQNLQLLGKPEDAALADAGEGPSSESAMPAEVEAALAGSSFSKE